MKYGNVVPIIDERVKVSMFTRHVAQHIHPHSELQKKPIGTLAYCRRRRMCRNAAH